MPTRQASEVNGVSGHTTWRTVAAAMATQNMNTIMLRLRTEPWLARAFTSTKTAVSRMNATSRQKATSRTRPVLYTPWASMWYMQSLKGLRASATTLNARSAYPHQDTAYVSSLPKSR